MPSCACREDDDDDGEAEEEEVEQEADEAEDVEMAHTAVVDACAHVHVRPSNCKMLLCPPTPRCVPSSGSEVASGTQA